MSQVTGQKCPNCGAAARFDPAAGKYVCDHCGTVIDIAPQKPAADGDHWDGFDFSQLSSRVSDPDAPNLPVYRCVSCGAEVIAPPEQAALTCPYCRNSIILTDKITGPLRPDGVIPFRIDSRQLPEAVRHFYRGKKLLPKGFFSAAAMGTVTGVYVPFWVFNGRISGRINLGAEKSSSSRKGDYIYTTTNYYQLVRDAALDFADLPVDASTKMDDRLMDSLEPFDTSQAQGFDMRYLAGFTADRFDLDKNDIAERAEKRMRTSAIEIVLANAGKGYSRVRYSSGRMQSDLHAQYLLFPVYMFDILHGGRKYHFAVNGQTGKVVGELPKDRQTGFLYFIKRAGITGGLLILFSAVRYFLGY